MKNSIIRLYEKVIVVVVLCSKNMVVIGDDIDYTNSEVKYR